MFFAAVRFAFCDPEYRTYSGIGKLEAYKSGVVKNWMNGKLDKFPENCMVIMEFNVTATICFCHLKPAGHAYLVAGDSFVSKSTARSPDCR